MYRAPGVYREEITLAPRPALRTGIPAFLGYVSGGGVHATAVETPLRLSVWPEFEQRFGPPLADGYLASAVLGFFGNGGQQCYVMALDPALDADRALERGLHALEAVDDMDLVGAPDIMRPRTVADLSLVQALQHQLVDHCDRLGTRLALLDSLPNASPALVTEQRAGLSGTNAALYYPWIKIFDASSGANVFVPPCGHVAGVYATADQQVGVHKPPANAIVDGALDLEVHLTDTDQAELNPLGINCLRAFPGRGIRVWGARTLSEDPAWTYVSVRRLFLTVARWIARSLNDVTFEPHDARLWSRVVRQLTAYFEDLFQRGALRGRTPQEAYYIKCDAETNPPEVREAGQLITEIGLAPGLPEEFVVVRLIQGPSGVAIAGPASPA
jgi:phage tail sheath protein FI